ncbi:bifunctional DNA-formamidopyrimidine glycosylase/DNA-(apurinic or apyrimidinic site) lyase [Thalassobaculum sp. OXR-137]|uniref:bifunctional DNA-formamidopyrimidine glycosylase/DNA-(apurinic or apyrimidinic site) lyase n=1 Tax=Thalassobaculum sp. OXR-137 TaxID=3100173 RepID=UPI002AC9B997|nr:bifunctional DNA-formamidopyrimidine glycosylase/DNA-(apurinic or apyrimidinic site) lyase [Thalassobaculum sp. OXR-137]WPZ35357.1 bifunctional DNA-formamidopyrimidine glycosylase/DNA-(apurinic or apyrimidinic site) lyase [Thalassobaculum sp. OXR-137]
MPELPEVETVMRGLAARLDGRTLAAVEVRRPDLRWPLPERMAERLTGRRILGLRRRAKYILVDLDDGTSWMIHLGMSGRMLISDGEKPPLEVHDHVVFRTDDGTWVKFNDARRFGMMDLWPTQEVERHKLLKGIGPEPLGNAFNGPALESALAGKYTPIKAALLDQKVVAGVGNIYACEALHRSGISPRRLALNVWGSRAERLAEAVRTVLTEAIAAGGSSLRDHRQVSGELGYFQHTFRVYDREGEGCPTPECGGTVKRLVQSGRSTFYCPRCQR